MPTAANPTAPNFAHLKTEGYGPGATVLCEVCGVTATRLFVLSRRWFCDQHSPVNAPARGA